MTNDVKLREVIDHSVTSPDIDIQNCRFVGGNPFEYEIVEDTPIPIVRLKSIKMNGWVCYAPGHEPKP